MRTSNIIDKPRKEGAEDLLGIDKYLAALIQFIQTCQMPTTLAIQGEWGSGKTS
jgi:predicted KAP-like P-loop ATPase